jgi:hypothetical protein
MKDAPASVDPEHVGSENILDIVRIVSKECVGFCSPLEEYSFLNR